MLFEVLPTDLAAHELRRFVFSDRGKCSGRYGYHNASTELADVIATEPYGKDGDVYDGHSADDHPHDDPRWPRACDCGYVFAEGDEWQHNAHRLWRRADAPSLEPSSLFLFNHNQVLREELWKRAHACGARTAPAGALRDCLWYRTIKAWQGDDGRSAELVLPDGCTWLIDGPSNNGDGWTRIGTWPNIIAVPSILTPGYHGWLGGPGHNRPGVLVPC